MAKQKENFIKVSDPEMVKQLTEEGYTLISEDGGVFTFLNDDIATTKFSKKSVVFSNRVTI